MLDALQGNWLPVTRTRLASPIASTTWFITPGDKFTGWTRHGTGRQSGTKVQLAILDVRQITRLRATYKQSRGHLERHHRKQCARQPHVAQSDGSGRIRKAPSIRDLRHGDSALAGIDGKHNPIQAFRQMRGIIGAKPSAREVNPNAAPSARFQTSAKDSPCASTSSRRTAREGYHRWIAASAAQDDDSGYSRGVTGRQLLRKDVHRSIRRREHSIANRRRHYWSRPPHHGGGRRSEGRCATEFFSWAAFHSTRSRITRQPHRGCDKPGDRRGTREVG